MSISSCTPSEAAFFQVLFVKSQLLSLSLLSGQSDGIKHKNWTSLLWFLSCQICFKSLKLVGNRL